jgi:[calcium/calmodulin-dependent protein kinase] kinase
VHFQGIIHRDIKPANLLHSTLSNSVKISDFGVSMFFDIFKQSQHTPSSSVRKELKSATSVVPKDHRHYRELAKTAGSPAFLAPELCTTGTY